MKKSYKTIVKIFTGLSFVFFFLSAWQVSLGNFAVFTPSFYLFGLPFGAFVWGDLLVFSLLWFVISIILLKLNSQKFFWIALYSFWLIRSLGEAIYWFLAQFNPHTVPWPTFFARTGIFSSLTDLEVYVAFQVFWQSLAVLSLIGLIYQITKSKK